MKLVLLIALLPLALAAKLQIIEAGVDMPWKKGPMLSESDTLCPDDLFTQISVECIPDKEASWAKISVNGEERQENVVPYTLSGDMNGMAYAWEYPTEANIKCVLSNGEEVMATVTFSCDGPRKTPKPDPAPSPSSVPAPTPSTPGPNPQPGPSGTGKCTSIKAKSYFENKGWVSLDNGGMGFKLDDSSQEIDGAGEFPLSYKFQPPEDGRYALTIDMLTNDPVEHNDVYVQIEGQTLSVERPGSVKTETGWIKAYHNKNGRAIAAFNVDFDPHAISTKNALKKGQTYNVRLGGRSTKVTVFAVLLFRCDGDQCRVGPYWNNVISKC